MLLGVVAWGRRAIFTSLVSNVHTVASCNRLSGTELLPESVGLRFDAHGLAPNALMFICMAVKFSVKKMNSSFFNCREAGWTLLHAGDSLETRLLCTSRIYSSV